MILLDCIGHPQGILKQLAVCILEGAEEGVHHAKQHGTWSDCTSTLSASYTY